MTSEAKIFEYFFENLPFMFKSTNQIQRYGQNSYES